MGIFSDTFKNMGMGDDYARAATQAAGIKNYHGIVFDTDNPNLRFEIKGDTPQEYVFNANTITTCAVGGTIVAGAITAYSLWKIFS